jgi:hypothetical protein
MAKEKHQERERIMYYGSVPKPLNLRVDRSAGAPARIEGRVRGKGVGARLPLNSKGAYSAKDGFSRYRAGETRSA